MSAPIPLEAKLAKRDRRKAKKLPPSILLLLIVCAALLNFIPMRVTLAVGTTAIDNILGAGATQTLVSLAGTHIDLEAASSFMNTTSLNALLKTSLNSTISPLNLLTKRVDFLALKSQSITVDIAQQAKTGGAGVLIQLRVTLVSLTISGYNVGKRALNTYNETTLAGLNPSLIVTLDRVFLDLFVDPTVRLATYAVFADMTVYQGFALLLEGTF